MPKSILLLLAAPLMLLTAVGCESTSKATFNVSLHNASKDPVTVWLTKNGGPREGDWLAPEDLSTSPAANTEPLNGVVIPPGKTGDVGPISGRFDPDSFAVLRVYTGKLTFDQILATPADGKLRVDVPLREGMNKLQVSPNLPLHVDRVGE